MNFDQVAIITLLLGMIAIYATERFRVELVALAGLAAGFTLGVVPLQSVFSGFSNPAVVTVVEILLIVGALSRTQLVERLAQAIVARALGERMVLGVLCVTGALVSVPMNNIGALALMIPVALSVCAKLRIAPERMLMPLSFATLLGGLCSLTGTPANLVVNEWLISETGGGFGYFELGLVGAPVAAAGILWLVTMKGRTPGRDTEFAAGTHTGPSEFLFEVEVTASSRLAGTSLQKAEQIAGLRIHDVVRAGAHVFARREDILVQPGDVMIAEGEIGGVERLVGRHDLRWSGVGDEQGRLAVVVMPESVILGSRVGWLDALEHRNVAVVAIAARHRRIEGRFEDLQIGLGDVLLLAGEPESLRQAAEDTATLQLASGPASQSSQKAWRVASTFLLGIAATASGLVPPEMAFGGVVLVMALTGSLRLVPGLQALNWSIVILLACMIPLGAAVQDTGAANVIANYLMEVLPAYSPLAVVAVMLSLTVAITPFVDNVSTAAVLSPIAASVAARAGIPIEPLLVAVAIGASLDFLTPFGHHNNAVVMGAGGYRFVDFPRVGAPLVLLCAPVALIMIWAVWL